jgi:hypothetical protein
LALTYGFYNSIDGDRVYDAKDLSSLFDGIINDGIFMSIGDYLMVTASTGMDIVVGTGRAWFNSTWTLNDAPIILTVDPAELVLNRIDTVVLEVNSGEEVRANSIKIVKGTPGTIPVAPTLTDTELVHQYPLANVYVGAGVTEIITANLTNKIGTEDCPFITGILSTINSAALLAQWGDEFDQNLIAWANEFDTWFNTNTVEWTGDFESWFTSIQGILTGDLAGALAQEILDHKNATMPHIFVDGETTYRWGLSVVAGVLTFDYEEVV